MRFVALLLVVTACGEAELHTSPGSGVITTSGEAHLETGKLRLMSGNLTSGNRQTWDLGEGIRILQGAHPDIAMLQELNYGANTPADFRAFVDQTFGTEFSYARGAPAQIPNGIVSRYPIVASGDWVDPYVSNRAFTWARIDVPGPTDLWAVSVHLLTSSSTNRQLEAQALVADLAQQVPPGDWVVIGGDFNTSGRSELALSTLAQTVVTSGPWPVDQYGNGNTNATRSKPYDWVVVSPALEARAIPTVVGESKFLTGLVVDTRTYSPLGELAPALQTDSAAVNMQHMGVVRDFDIRPPATLEVTSPNGGEQLVAGTSQLVTWSSTGLSTVDVDFSADGTAFERIASGVDATLGALGWTVPATASSTAVVRICAGSLCDLSNASFSVLPPPKPRVFLNELLANEPGSATYKEFVELYNAGDAAADLTGWALRDDKLVRHVFAAGTSLAPRATLVVFGGAAGVPPGLANAVFASSGALGLNNGSDKVTLSDAAGAAVDAVAYADPLAAVDGVSMNRSPDRAPDAPFVLHTALSKLTASPGLAFDGSP